ncbi:MAG TPA: ADOP family duplicated permease [Vicinamibacterales bacterium]|nr:ADOP family duplicated permease [Vicinamibacterales bacterium]
MTQAIRFLLDSLARDVAVGVRNLRKNPVVSLGAAVSLALALGACLTAITLVNALILRPLPVRDPGRLISLAFPTYSPERPESDTFNDPIFVALRDAARNHAALFAMSTQVVRPVIINTNGSSREKEEVRTQFVSGDAFARLGVDPIQGRLFTMDDDRQPVTERVAVISHRYWLRRFGGDAAVLGRSFTLEDKPFQIVGVTSSTFTGVEPGRPTDVWLPYSTYNPRAFGNRQFGWFRIMGRLNPGVTLDTANAVLHTTFTTVRSDWAQQMGAGRSREDIDRFANTPLYVRSAVNGPSPLRREFGRPLWILAAIAGLILLIAGSNIANLLLARTASREREMALRLSIGAARYRLIQQVLVESAVLALCACGLAIIFAMAMSPALVGMLSSTDDPISLNLRPDWRVVLFTSLIALGVTCLFGLAPALRASAASPMTSLKTGSARAGIRASAMRPIVALQVAFSLAVLMVGTLLVLSLAELDRVNPGFATSNVLLLNLETTSRMDPAARRTALLEMLDRIRTVPGVQSASAAAFNALGRAWTHTFDLPASGRERVEVTMQPVVDKYFETLQIPVLSGRAFERADLPRRNPAAIVVSETFAKSYFGSEAAVGRIITAKFDDTGPQQEIIGVVADTRYDVRKPSEPTIYLPMMLQTTGTVQARVSGDVVAMGVRLRDEVKAGASPFRVSSTQTQDAVVDGTLLKERLLARLSGFFGVVGLLLALVGLYGVLSYLTIQRTRELGIRAALGCGPVALARLVLSQAGVTVLAGTALGLGGGLYLSRFVETFLFGVTPLQFWSLAMPIATLWATAALAAAWPSWRAARVDAVIALRAD